MGISKIYAVWVYVSDLAQSTNFYQSALSLRIKFQDNDWVEFDLGDTSFALLKRPGRRGPVKPQKTRIMFQTDDIEKAREKLQKQSVKIIGDIRHEPYGKLLTFEDPNGHWLELFEPKTL